MPQTKSFLSRYKAPVVVFGVFFAGVVLLLAIGRHIANTQIPSTPLATVLAFAWALITMIVSGTYAIATGKRIRSLAQTSRELDVHVRSYVPAIINGASSIGLAVFVVALRTHGYSTLYGTAIGLLVPCYMIGWTWNSWPRAARRADSKL